MAPNPQEHNLPTARDSVTDQYPEVPMDGDRIVISGMAGLYPQTHNLKELSEILYEKKNPITSEGLRWNYKHPELGEYAGVAPDMDRFDAQFFSVYQKLGIFMDPMSRKLLETTYEALYDAGISPSTLNGKKIAVFVGASQSDSESKGFFDDTSKSGLGILGTSKTMFANRISFWLNTKGPSLFIDEAECSASSALEQAYLAIRRGDCEAAIVGGSNVCLKPQATIHYSRIAMISKDGNTKPYCQDASGFIRSDASNVIILQRAKDAFRVYAELLHVRNEFISMVSDSMGPKFGYNRDPRVVAKFIKEFYKEAQVPPQAVEYVEGCGIAVPESDKTEIEALDEVYCNNRDKPLLIGSVTSNIGHTIAASSLTGITKVLLGYHKGKLAANLHSGPVRQDVSALREGRIRVVGEHHPIRHSYAAVNGISVTGVNSHVLLRGNYKPKNLDAYKSAIPRLVALSARQDSSIVKMIADLKSRPIDAEELALLHNIHSHNISGHLGRGYVILDTENNKTVSLREKSEQFDNAPRPLWFVYSGMGSQWAGMGTDLLRIPVFAAAIERCQKVLEPIGLNIKEIITSKDTSTFDSILNSFVGIAAIQIGLTDILREIGLVPDGIIGHSVGELGCAYADGCMTAEEMIMAAYSRGSVSKETEFIEGSMAAVGLGYNKIIELCPPEIDVACHNSADSCTISGPADIMQKFVADLTAQGVFAKEVPCSNIAYHSRYIKCAGPHLLKHLKKLIKDPKPRSSRWLSTSVPQDKWNDESAKYCSAEYQVNNLLSPVLFEETSRLIPSNAILVEIAPHGLLQAILKRSMPSDCRNIALTRRGHPNSAVLLLEAIGNLYMEGCVPKIQALYPKVQFPVSTGTPMLSHFVDWCHVEEWPLSTYVESDMKKKAAARNIVLSIVDDEHSYLQGHVVRGKTCYPSAATLVAVWDTLAMHLGIPKQYLSVQFQDVHLFAQPILLKNRPLKLYVALHRGTGKFEVVTEVSRVASGRIERTFIDTTKSLRLNKDDTIQMGLPSEDVYQLLRDRNYMYSGEFQSIVNVSSCLRSAEVSWRNNWVTLIDSLLQLNVLRHPHDAVSLPTYIKLLNINLSEHFNGHTFESNGQPVMKAHFNHKIITCGGVVMENVQFEDLPQLDQDFNRTAGKRGRDALNQGHLPSNVKLQSAHIGNLDSLQWVETPAPEPFKITVEVHYAGLNLSDIKRSTGVIKYDSNDYGMDYSGTTKSGQSVMGIVASGAASTRLAAVPELLWPVPSSWSLEDAATVPLAYAHAFYCLKIKTDLQPGMNVLVHGGLGALGQAAIRIALAHDCQVFATVSDLRKKKFLQKLFPQLTDAHIANSRDGSFLEKVKIGTKAQGCDIVISCVKGLLKNTSLDCLAFSGTLIDTVQIKDHENYEFGMYLMTRQRSFVASDFSSIFTEQKREDMKKLQALLCEGIAKGYVRPLARVTYEAQDAVAAFQFLASGHQRGRVLLRIKNSVPTSTCSRIICSSDKYHVMFWNNGVFGVQLADRLIKRGAKKLYIQSTDLSPYHLYKIQSWRKAGIEVVVSAKHIAHKITEVIKDVLHFGDVEGIYFVAVAKDNITVDKQKLIQNVNDVSKIFDSKLKYFAVVSTITGFGRDLYQSLGSNGFSVTNVDLSSISKEQGVSTHDMVEATECALCGDRSVQAVEGTRQSLLQQLAAMADIDVPDTLSYSASLKELGMSDETSPQIAAHLKITHNVNLDEDQIPTLTVEKIKEIEDSTTEAVPKDVKGFGTFFSFIDTDEMVATTDIVVLPTAAEDYPKFDEMALSDKKCLYIIPGLEGHHERFRTLCERLKLPALVLQPGLDRPKETVLETAHRYAQILINKTKIQDNFYLMGYESGVMVALELAAILEDKGYKGTVFCIGHDPEEFRAVLESNINEYDSEEQLEDALIRHMLSLMLRNDTVNLDNALQCSKTWQEKADACVHVLSGRAVNSTQYARAHLEAALQRIKLVQSYVPPKRTLQSKLILLRASTQVPSKTSTQVLSKNPLQTISSNTIVHQMNSPLSDILKDMECTAIINRHLEADIKTAFEQNNLCETYFMTN